MAPQPYEKIPMPNSATTIQRVLVVDDEESARILLREYLKSKRFQVEVAEAGEEALAKIYNFHPHLVLLDVMMPRLTGDELVKMITDWKPEIKVIMVSANLNPELEKECILNGAQACIQKPVDLDQLLETIKQTLT
jgi:CheY-like chemotaxis protein